MQKHSFSMQTIRIQLDASLWNGIGTTTDKTFPQHCKGRLDPPICINCRREKTLKLCPEICNDYFRKCLPGNDSPYQQF